MYTRPFMREAESLTILLDSHSLDEALLSLNRRSRVLLQYDGVKSLKFLRTPESTRDRELQKIVEFRRKTKSDGSLHSIEITRGEHTSKYAFGYGGDSVERIGKYVLGKDELDTNEKRAIELVFIHATLKQSDPLNILVTENDALLKNRSRFKSHFTSGLLSIMTLEEAVEGVDLFMKQKGEYPISHHYNANKGYWYWLSFRTKVPFYHVTKRASPFEKSILDSFAQRFVFLLMSVDEIGFDFYKPVNNDTMDNTIYHFNYFVSLMSGILDSLALQTFNQYKLVFEGSQHRSRISLYKKSGKEFLKAIRDENPSLRKHISKYVHFINAIPILRERILHREGLQEVNFDQACLIRIPSEFVDRIKQCGDNEENFEPWTEFGVYSHSFLVPYKFAKTATLLLSRFCNKYLQLLGFKNFIEQLEKEKPQDSFLSDIRLFERDNLGL